MGRVLPFLVYAAISLLFFGHRIGAGTFFMFGGDSAAYVWFLKWWPFSISHGLNPFITDYIWSPVGFSMMWANSIPTLALIMSPVTALFGPVTSWNILCLAAPVLNAWCAFFLLKHLFRRPLPAAIGGFIFGFSPYISSHMLGHVSLTFIPVVPLIALIAIKRAQGLMKRPIFIALMALLATLQFGISMEILATAAFFGAVTYLALYIPYHKIVPYRKAIDMKGLAVDVFIAAIVTAVIVSPAFYFLYKGAAQLPDVINSPVTFSNDIAGFVVPMNTIWMGGHWLEPVTSNLSGGRAEENAYLGFPLIAIFILAAWRLRSNRWAMVLVGLVAFAAMMSLGPMFWVTGTPTFVASPGVIASHIPLLRHALPGRFAGYTALGVAVIVTGWIAAEASIARYVAVLCALVFILPNPDAYWWKAPQTPLVYSDASSLKDLNSRGAVLSLPFNYKGLSTMWQVNSNFGFKTAGGYVGFTPRHFEGNKVIEYLYGNQTPIDGGTFRKELLDFCRDASVGSIVIGPGTPAELVKMLHDLGWPTRTVGDSEILSVP